MVPRPNRYMKLKNFDVEHETAEATGRSVVVFQRGRKLNAFSSASRSIRSGCVISPSDAYRRVEDGSLAALVGARSTGLLQRLHALIRQTEHLRRVAADVSKILRTGSQPDLTSRISQDPSDGKLDVRGFFKILKLERPTNKKAVEHILVVIN